MYEQIKQHILRAIETGELKPNEQIPTEQSLREQFEVSRMTVNKAISELRDAGIITRIPGLGSFVAEFLPKSNLIKVNNIAEEVRGRGHKYHAKVIQNKVERATKEVSALMGIPIKDKVYRSIIVHHENDVPIQIEDRYVSPEIAPDYIELDLEKNTPYVYLQAIAPLHRVEHRVKAVSPDKKSQKLLNISANEPCLLLLRRTWTGNKVVAWGRYLHPGTRFEFSDIFEI